MKKFLVALIIILFLLLLSGVVWLFFFGSNDAGIDIVGPNENERIFFPTSPSNEEETPTDESSIEAPTPTFKVAEDIPKLRQITDRPTSGFNTFDRTREQITDVDGNSTTTADQTVRQIDETVYRYIERATGHIYEATDKTLTLNRLSNTTIPRIQEGFVSSDGNDFVFRYFNESSNNIETYSATLLKEELTEDSDSDMQFDGQFLPINISEVDFGPDDRFVYVTSFFDEITGDVSVYTSNTTSIGTEIFRSPLSEWIPQWINPNLITLTSKADSRVKGLSYNINPLTGNTSIAISDINGLTTNTNPTGAYILYSESRAGRIETFVRNTNDGTTIRLNVSTLPEKCAWSTVNATTLYCAGPNTLANGDYPEDWYQGDISFVDTLWKIDVDIQSYRQILTPTDGQFDIIKPSVAANNKYITFINKKDLSLWTLEL